VNEVAFRLCLDYETRFIINKVDLSTHRRRFYVRPHSYFSLHHLRKLTPQLTARTSATWPPHPPLPQLPNLHLNHRRRKHRLNRRRKHHLNQRRKHNLTSRMFS
jgi:hypothetical protein